MDTTIGAKERVTQNRLIGLFRRVLKYAYLGNWEKRESNNNVEEEYLSSYLTRRGYTDKEIRSAIAKLKHKAKTKHPKNFLTVFAIPKNLWATANPTAENKTPDKTCKTISQKGIMV